MKYYHGTTTDAAEAIESEGWYGSELSVFTGGGVASDRTGVVYLTDSVGEAQGYGNVVFEIELLNEQPEFFQESPVGDANEYYISAVALNRDGIWRVFQCQA
jgi:hypothetical protein